MRRAIPTEAVGSALPVTPDLQAAIQSVVTGGVGGTLPQVDVVGTGPVVERVILVMGTGERRSGQRPQYVIRKGLKRWLLVFEGGDEEVLPDDWAVYYVAYLLRNPPAVPMHGAELAHRAIGDAVVDGQRNAGADDEEVWARQRQARRECRAVIDDEQATPERKAEAERDLVEINEWALKHQRGTEGREEKQVRAIRANIRRLLESLAEATDHRNRPHERLRSFGEHLDRYLWKPSTRGSTSRNGRVKAGWAGRFTYEPPAGVKWSG